MAPKPVGHTEQKSDPTVLLYVPDGQAEQSLSGPKNPGGQGPHTTPCQAVLGKCGADPDVLDDVG